MAADVGPDADADAAVEYAAALVLKAARCLKLGNNVACTGMSLTHRFFSRKSVREWDVRVIARACLYLAAKLEERPKPLREVVPVFDRLERRRAQCANPEALLDFGGDEYARLRRETVDAERAVLCEFGFLLHVEHPHKLAISYLRVLELPHLMQLAWNCCNDSLRTPVCVQFPANVVACGCLAFAAARAKVCLPTDPPWWLLFVDGHDEHAGVLSVVDQLRALHRRGAPSLPASAQLAPRAPALPSR